MLKKAYTAFSFKCSRARIEFPVGVRRAPKYRCVVEEFQCARCLF